MEFANAQAHATYYTEWIVECFAKENISLDYSIGSLKHLDNFIEKHSNNGKVKPEGILAQNSGTILYGIGIYLGETIIKNTVSSTWQLKELYKEDSENAIIKLQNGTTIFPVQKVLRRFYNGEEDSISPYAIVVIKEMIKEDYWEKMKANHKDLNQAKKPWWKKW